VRKAEREELDAEEQEILNWILEHADIKEIDDVAFRKAIYDGISRQDRERRFVIHNTDLIYCLRLSWANKVFMKEYSEENYEGVWHWLRGKGVEIGTVNALKNVMGEHGVVHQKIVRLGRSIGSIDISMRGKIYEIATRLFYGSEKNPKKYPPLDKVLQLITYVVGDSKKSGRVKVYVMAPPKETVDTEIAGLDATVKKDIKRNERTWEVTLKDDYFGPLFVERGDMLHNGLMNGDWRSLPEAFFKWRCNYCSIEYGTGKVTLCQLMNLESSTVHARWLEWFDARRQYLKERYAKLIKHDAQRLFTDSYGRAPKDEEELDTFMKYMKMSVGEV